MHTVVAMLLVYFILIATAWAAGPEPDRYSSCFADRGCVTKSPQDCQ